ncbi:MAG: hypothetical protein KAV82_13255 [Phycisphaerae bacterium]|nr:hypothetical protein [Phycisphaerae bacterium]
MTYRLTQALALTTVCILGISHASAETITYQYDELHRLIDVTYDDGAWIHYEYDAVGNQLLEVMNPDADVGYLHITVDPAGSGDVGRNPDLVWCPLNGDVVLAATTNGLCEFDYWSGDVPTGHESDNPLTINMGTARYVHLVAHFDSPHGHMDDDCNSNGIPDGCEWSDTNSNGALDACDPLIGRSPATLVNTCGYGEIASGQAFDVWNVGLPGTLLSYYIECSETWLSFDPSEETSAGETDTIIVHYNGSSSLDCGEHQATITINDPDAGNTPQTIDVTLTVTDQPAICEDGATLTNTCEYGEIAPDESFELWNCGPPGTELTYEITDDADWLWCEWPGEPLTDQPATVTVHYDSAALPAGQHWGTITISAPGAGNDPREVPAVLTVACPVDGWLPWDMNYDGFISIIGEVPPFVDCVYFADCYCPGPGCLCPGDCNLSGFLSIIGDVQCFVDCVYFGDCDGGRGGPGDSRGEADKRADGTFTIGGAVYTDLDNPLGSGLEGVRIRVMRLKPAASPTEIVAHAALMPDHVAFTAPAHQPAWRTTSGTWGLWRIDGLQPGWYVVAVGEPSRVLKHIQDGVGAGKGRVRILVSPATEAENQSIQFFAIE